MMIFFAVILVVIIGWIWVMYNGLIAKKLHVEEAWSQIDVQLKRRTDLIPNLVESVKAYAKHEKSVFEDVAKARTALMTASGPKETAKAENILSGALKSLFAVAESYPKLEASVNFKSLQDELTDTEDKVAYSRQFYNTVVLEYNTATTTFPNVILANAFGFKSKEFFQIDDSQERKSVKVGF